MSARTASPEDRAAKQRLRLRRFLLASSFSTLYVVVLAAFHAGGLVDTATLLGAAVAVAALIVLFFVVFQLGLNLRFGDPSLTAPQVLAAVVTMLVVFYRAPDTRLVFAAFFFVALMFGMLRSSAKELGVLGGVSLAGFALASLIRHAQVPDWAVFEMDLLQFFATAVAFPWFVVIGAQVKRLKDADRAKDDFLATLAHELRNPLAPIRTGVQILRMTEDARSAAQTVLPMMERQLKHVTRLLDDLLDVSRIARGKIALHVDTVDLGNVVRAAVEAARPLMEEMGHELVVSLPAEPLSVRADPVRLAQILSNLLDNAAKYTPPGGRVALKAEQRGDALTLAVSDDGLGIPCDRLESIFDMFEQIESPERQARGGLGIGLSLVRGLVGLHRGTIEARSDGPGRGSTFVVCLPNPRAHAPGPAARQPGEDRPRERLRILAVDDDRDTASTLSTCLLLMGHEVRVAYEGEQAVRLATDFRPDAALIDIGLPGISGYEVCRRIREQPWGAGVALVAVTGWGQDEDRRRSAAAGFDAHLLKPVSPETLVQTLQEAHRLVEQRAARATAAATRH